MQAKRNDPEMAPRHLAHDLKLAFQGTPDSVRRALATTMEALSDLALDEEEAGTVELVLAEALNNVVEHAYTGPTKGWVQLGIRHDAKGLHVGIRDMGQPMPAGGVPLGDLADGSRARLDTPEGGFGWFIIRDLARDIEYRRDADVNVLTFRIAVAVELGPMEGA